METDNITYLWLIAGGVFLALEAFGIPGIGFFFAGMAALCVAIVVESAAVAPGDYFMQLVWFLGLTAAWAALLWKPMKQFWTRQKQGPAVGDVVGETVTVAEGGLKKGQEGRVHWSGTTMLAELAPAAAVTEIAAGGKARVVSVKGSKLIVDA